MTTDNGLEVFAARMEGVINTLSAELRAQITALGDAIKFGDNQNAQMIKGLLDAVATLEHDKGEKTEVDRSHSRIDRLEERISANSRLALTGLVFPFLVAVAVFVFHAATQVGR